MACGKSAGTSEAETTGRTASLCRSWQEIPAKFLRRKKVKKVRGAHARLIRCACDRVACVQTHQARSDMACEAGSLARGAVESVSTGAISALIRLACRAAKADVAAVNARKNGHRERSDVAALIGGCSAAMPVGCAPSCSMRDTLSSALCRSSRRASRALDGSSDRALAISFIAT